MGQALYEAAAAEAAAAGEDAPAGEAGDAGEDEVVDAEIVDEDDAK
jgi:molecular chaperone DnaK